MCLSTCSCTTCVPLDELAFVYTCVWMQEASISCFPQSLFLFLRWYFTELWAHCGLHWQVSEPQGSICLCNPNADVIDTCLVSMKLVGKLNIGLHLCKVSILPAKRTLQLFLIIWSSDYHVLWDSSPYPRPPYHRKQLTPFKSFAVKSIFLFCFCTCFIKKKILKRKPFSQQH